MDETVTWKKNCGHNFTLKLANQSIQQKDGGCRRFLPTSMTCIKSITPVYFQCYLKNDSINWAVLEYLHENNIPEQLAFLFQNNTSMPPPCFSQTAQLATHSWICILLLRPSSLSTSVPWTFPFSTKYPVVHLGVSASEIQPHLDKYSRVYVLFLGFTIPGMLPPYSRVCFEYQYRIPPAVNVPEKIFQNKYSMNSRYYPEYLTKVPPMQKAIRPVPTTLWTSWVQRLNHNGSEDQRG